MVKMETGHTLCQSKVASLPEWQWGHVFQARQTYDIKETDLRSEVVENDCIALIYHTVCSQSISDRLVSWPAIVVYSAHSDISFPL